MIADLVLKNANVYTMDQDMNTATGIAIKQQKIIFVGDEEDLKDYIGEYTKIVDIKGKMVLPGFIDAHAHPVMTAFLSHSAMFDMDMKVEDVVNMLKKHIEENPDDEAYIGIAYNESIMDPQKYTKQTLDEICPNKPLMLMGSTFHEGWCNSKALEIAGVDKRYIDPVPGVQYFCRNSEGEPTGRMIEIEPTEVIFRAINAYNVKNAKLTLKGIIDEYNSLGVTSIAECGIVNSAEKMGLDTVAEMKKNGELSCRIFGSIFMYIKTQKENVVDLLQGLNSRFHDDEFCIRTLKIILDGCIEGRSASCFEKYKDFEELTEPMLYGEELRNLFLEAAEKGFDIHLHGLGDRAVHETLMAAKHVREAGYDDIRITNAHTHCVLDEDLGLFKKYNVISNFTPQWFHFKQCNVDALGEEKACKLLRMKSLMDSGAICTIGSDMPSDEIGIEPVKAIEMAITRQLFGQKETEPLEPISERLSMTEALKACTINAAYQLHLEDKLGSIEIGKYADIIVMDKNLYEVDTYDIHNVQVAMTIYNGEIVYNQLIH